SADAQERLGGAVPSPAAAFLMALIALPSLFWLVTLKRTTVYTRPEEWLMQTVMPQVHHWVEVNLPPVDALLLGISALGSGWFVALGFAVLGLLAMAKGRRDLAIILAFGVLCFPMEWALKYFTSDHVISLSQLIGAIFNAGGTGLDDIADFPAGHALRATVFYGLAAFCVARLAPLRRQGVVAYLVALALIGAISLTRLYLLAHFPMDLLGGWIAGGALLSVIVAVHVLRVDERLRAREAVAVSAQPPAPRRVAVPLRNPTIPVASPATVAAGDAAASTASGGTAGAVVSPARVASAERPTAEA
ncbi:MAG TPA: phosphatase PAP2 family protein, partial [Candidatus Limnocylindria bacterium]|nr:phosphatase PAP2 family protein [Candidatus Limnocylindria bacterium]